MRMLAALGLLLFATTARAEDPAATLAAMPNVAAASRYFGELCRRATAAEDLYVAEMTATQWCWHHRNDACDGPGVKAAFRSQDAHRRVHAGFLDDLENAAAAFRAKYPKAKVPACAALESSAAKRIADKEAETNAAISKP